MQAWIQANGGLVASFGLCVIVFNVVMTGIKKVCDTLKIQEPGFLQKLGSIGAAVAEWLSANTTHKPPQA